jgi:lysophospholipase L1-like esterase
VATKTILCYGDSNTWGSVPMVSLDRALRYSREQRWPGVLRRELGADYEVIEEGCPGRTTVWDDPIEGDLNGKTHLPHILHSHQPLDLVTIMLGTNDLKARFGKRAYDIALAAGTLVDMVRWQSFVTGETPQVLLITPPPVPMNAPELFREMFWGAGEKSRQFAHFFRQVAEQRGCGFLDAGEIVETSQIDGVHLDLESHTKLGLAVAQRVREMLE